MIAEEQDFLALVARTQAAMESALTESLDAATAAQLASIIPHLAEEVLTVHRELESYHEAAASLLGEAASRITALERAVAELLPWAEHGLDSTVRETATWTAQLNTLLRARALLPGDQDAQVP